ncbi:unnamed protein product [Rotaria sordida]|uniref:Uncharacterized protein n=1 Tax=Rotaria sordida TaxID=392033 RepID=A0A818ZVP3_9BILA|nr:unnamed protein product [Rotaria sordida]CAF3774586.1 unnamed protein product [Rotaria sordida]
MINTSHFQGGTITYKIINTYGSKVSIMITQTYIYKWPLVYCDNSYILSQSTPNISSFNEYNYKLNCIANCTTRGGYIAVPVRTYCIDYSAAMSISVTQRTDIVNITSGAYFKVAFVSSAWRTLSLPIGDPIDKGWSISCTIDLRTRSDTGKPNTPPVANMISPVLIPVGIRQSLIIPTIDSDNDVVRCRFANTTNECSDVCPPSSLPNNTVLISSNCTLLITGAQVDDWYAVAIQIEDFISSNSTTPLSSVPVQLLINVYDSPNCIIAPLLYGPNNQTGTCESIQVGQSHSIILYAENYCSNYSVTIVDIATLSFPIVIKSNIIQNTSTLYSVSLTWTPTIKEIGSQILCAIAVDSQNVQSNQYCMTFVVRTSGTQLCPGEVLETSTSSTITQGIFTESSSFIDDLTTYINDKQSSADDTSSITTTTTTINTTTASSSNGLSWLLPVIIAVAAILSLLCCLCLCCPSPYGLGLLYRKHRRDVSSEPLPNTDQIHQLPRVYMIYRRFNNDFDGINRPNSSLESSRSTNESDIYLDLFSKIPRDNMNKKGNNDRWAYPSPRFYEIGISRAEYRNGKNYIKRHKNLIQTYSSYKDN